MELAAHLVRSGQIVGKVCCWHHGLAGGFAASGEEHVGKRGRAGNKDGQRSRPLYGPSVGAGVFLFNTELSAVSR
jgi:hypothetical protein